MADNINTYMGDVALGQGTAGGGIGPIAPFDYKEINDAVDKSMYYQVMEKRDVWARNNILLDEQAKAAEDNMSFEFGDVSQVNQERLTEQLKDLNAYFSDNPNSFRLLPDMSNAKEVAEMQKRVSNMKSSIKAAQRQQTQLNGVITQVNQEKDENKRSKMMDYYEGVINTPLGQDILLYGDFEPYQFADPTYHKPVSSLPYVDPTGKTLLQDSINVPDLQKAANQYMVDAQTNADANRAIKGGVESFNSTINKVKAANPGKTAQELHDLILNTPEGNAYMKMYDQMAHSLTLQNQPQVLASLGLTKQPIPDWEKGIDDNTFALMQAASRGQISTNTTTIDAKYGLQKEQNEIDRMNAKTSRMRVNNDFYTWQKDRETKTPEGFAIEEKTQLFSTVLNAQDGTPDKNGYIDVSVTPELENALGFTFPKSTKTTKESDKVSYTEAYDKPTVKVRVKPGGADKYGATYEVSITNPASGKAQTKNMSVAEMWNALDYMNGEKDRDAIRKASRALENFAGSTTPRMEKLYEQFDPTIKSPNRGAGAGAPRGVGPNPLSFGTSTGSTEDNPLRYPKTGQPTVAGWYVKSDGTGKPVYFPGVKKTK